MSGVDGWKLLEEEEAAAAAPPAEAPPAAGPPLPEAPESTVPQLETLPQVDGWGLLEQQDKQKAEGLRTLIGLSLDKQPDRQAGVMELARRTGINSDLVEANYDAFSNAARASQYDADRLIRDFPEVADWALQHPEGAGTIASQEGWFKWLARNMDKALAHATALEAQLPPGAMGGTIADIQAGVEAVERQQEAGVVEGVAAPKAEKRREIQYVVDTSGEGKTGLDRLSAISGAAWQQSQKQVEYSNLGFEIMLRRRAGLDTYEKEKRAIDLKHQLAPRHYGQGPVLQVGLDVLELAGPQLATLKEAGIGGVVGAVGGAVVGGVAGYFLKNPALARKFAKTVGSFGFKAGNALGSFKQETGGAYFDFSEMRTDDGKPLSEELVAGGAVIYGVVSSAIETGNLPAFLGQFGKLGDEIAGGAGPQAVKAAMKDPRFRSLVADAGKRWLTAVKGEVKEEFLQSVTQSVSGYYVQTREAGELQAAHPFTALAEAGEAGAKVLTGVAPIGAPRVVAKVVQAGFTKSADAQGAQTGQVVVQATKEASPAVRGAPEAVVEVIKRKAAEAGADASTVYVDAVQLQRVAKESGVDVAELMGADADARLQAAVATGAQQVELPLPFVLQAWAGLPAAEALAPHVTMKRGGPTTAQLEAQEATAVEKVAAIEKAAEEEGGLPEESDGEVRLVAAVQGQLQALGYNPADARALSTPLRAFLRTQAARFHKSVDELFDWNVWVEGVQRGQAPGVALEATPAETTTGEAVAAPAEGTAAPAQLEAARAAASHHLEYTLGLRKDKPAGQPAPTGEAPKRYRQAAAVVPDDASPKVLEALQRRGIARVHTYKAGDESSRSEAIATAAADADILFQDKEGDARGFVELSKQGKTRTARIVLGAQQNMSTFLHETGHVFLEMMQELAAREDAPASVKADMATIRDALGLKEGEALEEKHHEVWARMQEAYFREGKAPSAALAPAFKRFHTWLRQVYRSILALDVELSPEVRGVMDRMLATDAEIAEQKQRAGREDMWTDATAAGMTPQEWEDYQSAKDEAEAFVNGSVQAVVAKDRAQESTPAWQKEKQRHLEAALEAYDELPAARAAAALANTEMDRAAVERVLGPEEAERRFGDTLAEVGEFPDDVAEWHGFPTAADMFAALDALPSREEWAEAEATARMREGRPDILEDRERLGNLVQAALHADAATRPLELELRTLRQKAGRDAASAPIEAMGRAAEVLVGKRRLQSLDTAPALQLEKAKGSAAAQAFAAGAFREAEALKQQQLLNHLVVRETAEAQAEAALLAEVAGEVDADSPQSADAATVRRFYQRETPKQRRDVFEDFAASFRSDSARARLLKAHPAFRDVADGLLEALGAREVPADRTKPLLGVGDALPALMEAGASTEGFDADVVRGLLAKPRNWQTLTVSELRAVVEALKTLKATALTRTTTMKEGKRVEQDGEAQKLAAEVRAHMPSREELSSSGAAEGHLTAFTGWFHGATGSLLKAEMYTRWMGGDNPSSAWNLSINLPMQEAAHREADLLKSVVEPISDALEQIPEKVRNSLSDKVDGRKLFPTHIGEPGPPSRRFELLTMALQWGTQRGRDLLTKGRNITEAEVEAALQVLTKEEWDWAQTVWDQGAVLWELSSALEERDSGLTPRRMPTTPVQTPHGTYRGGYFAPHFDRRISRPGPAQKEGTLSALLDPRYTRPAVATGANVTPGVIDLDLGGVFTHLAQLSHDIAFREVVKSVGGLLEHPDVKDAMEEKLGPRRSKQLMGWVQDVGKMRGVEAYDLMKEINAGIRMMSGAFAKAVLGYSAKVATGDAANIARAATLIGADYMAAGLGEYAQGWEVLEGRPATNTAVAFVREKSGEMRLRDEEILSGLRIQLRKMMKGGPFSRGPLAWYRDNAFVFMEWSDKATSTPIWIGAYRRALDGGATDENAVREADALIRDLFPSSSVVNKSALMRDKGFFSALFSMHGYMNVVYNQQANVAHKAKVARAKHGNAEGARVLMGGLLSLHLTTSVLGALCSGGGPEKDEEWWKFYLRKLLLGPLSVYPVPVASVFESWVLGKKPSVRAAPGFAFIEPIATAAQLVWEGKAKNDKVLKAALRAAGIATATPVGNLPNLEYMYELATGEEQLHLFQTPRGLIFGDRDERSRDVFTGMEQDVLGP